MSLPTRELGTSGLDITRVGLGAWAIGGGAWEFGWGPQDDSDSIAAMHGSNLYPTRPSTVTPSRWSANS